MTQKWIIPFDEGRKEMQSLLGGKGAGLAEMSRLGIPVPPGFIIPTEAWRTYTTDAGSLPDNLWREVREALRDLEAKSGRVFGSRTKPLIVSVRSSPVISMPGQLETILNVGLTTEIVTSLAKLSQQPRFVYDTYRRLIQRYGRVVHNIPNDRFRAVLTKQGWERSLEKRVGKADLEEFRSVADEFLALFRKETGEDFPQDPYEQLRRSIVAVFDSWFGQNAIEYRAFHQIPDDLGTGIVVQMMVFGNLGPNSGTGVVFSRNPATGEKQLYGEYLPNSQGEDVVAGGVTPYRIAELAQESPEVFDRLRDICTRLEGVYHDMQDVEFTIEDDELWILQTRSAKRAPLATVKVAVDMASEGLISRDEAVRRVNPALIGQLFVPCFSEASSADVLAEGIPSSPGAVSGKVALNRNQVEKMAREDLPVILVREQTSPDDVPIMPLVFGILTQHGGSTSHAAVVARGLGKPCVVGCEALQIDLDQEVVHLGEVTIEQGDDISIDGTTGKVFKGRRELASTCLAEFRELNTLLTWADEMRRLRVLADANTPAEIEAARELNAEAIGLCRTERMFYDEAALPLFRDAILAESTLVRQTALDQLHRLHREEFRAIFQAARGLPVTVCLLNVPPDHFLPMRDTLLTELAELWLAQGWSEDIGRREQTLQAIDMWRQSNPEYGLRGARLVAALPHIVLMQIQALLEGACDAARDGIPSRLQILVPLVSHSGEVDHYLQLIRETAQMVMRDEGVRTSYRIGAMIETPRAAVVANELASLVDFLCIDSDGLTESVFCYSREDSNKFLPTYVTEGILSTNPFLTLDVEGVGWLVQLAVERARSVRADIDIGLCGSHSHDLASVRLFHQWGLDFISCYPSHLLAVRLAAAQVAAE